ncbi:adenosylcobinamide-GDP ribazoletransferase [Alkalicoccus chagannorensis]|uniref:adenosylcobinamide-GDP ribazoletransferase n=1 Tax=Alkalicoccus chagannorensis TaxID=427072 RepID=UPI0004160344|nr:adenosylcobinamide-GDP ribazoletransferase [Alkalicoccus chagannorensis]
MRDGWILAVQFLTRIPLPLQAEWHPQSSRWALRFYPWIGLLIGAVTALVAVASSGVESWVAALFVLTVWCGWSGGLHMDGVADTADAFGANTTKERQWEIMKDPHTGAFGVMALVFLLMWKLVLIEQLLAAGSSLWMLVLIPAAARAAAGVLLITTPSGRQEGLAAAWKEALQPVDLLWLTLPFLLLAFSLPVSILAGSFIFWTMLMRYWMIRRFGGINGDLAGTSIEGGELWGLMILWSLLSSGML